MTHRIARPVHRNSQPAFVPSRFWSGVRPLVAGACFVALGTCASVQPLTDGALRPRLPEIRPLALDSATASDTRDYKLRESAQDRIRLTILTRPLAPEQAPKDRAAPSVEAQDLAFFKLQSRLASFPDVEVIRAPQNLSGSAGPEAEAPLLQRDHSEASAWLEQVEADGVVVLRYVPGENPQRGQVELELIDPYLKRSLAKHNQPVEFPKRDVRDSRQSDFVREGGTYVFLEPISAAAAVLSGAAEASARQALRDFILASVTARISVRSSSPDAEVLLVDSNGKRESLGNAPVSSQLREGRRRLLIRRKGYDPETRELLVRAGRDRDIFISWPDDRDITALAVLSSPSGSRVSLDGAVRGRTPLYITSMDPGAYQLELSREVEGEGGLFQVAAETQLEISGGEREERVFFHKYATDFSRDLLDDSDYWQLSAEEGAVSYEAEAGLAFRTDTSGEAWMGLASRPVAIDEDFELALRVAEGEGQLLSFGLINPDAESALAVLDGERYNIQRFLRREAAGEPQLYRTTAQTPGDVHEIRFSYRRLPEEERAEAEGKPGVLRIEIDGDTVWLGPYDGGRAARIALLTRPAAADGRVLAESLEMQSGPAVYAEPGAWQRNFGRKLPF